MLICLGLASSCDYGYVWGMTDFILNALDQSPVNSATNPALAVAETVALATHTDALGYRRFWLAEHHNTSAFAGAAPEILIGHIAAKTRHLRVGSGGVMLPHYSPMKVAEVFRMLDTLAPGRIDLGLGRAPGGDARTAAALQAGPKSWPPEVFPQQVEMLVQFLEDAAGLSGADGGFPDDHPYQGIHAQPMGDHVVPLFMLGSGGDGAYHAAQFGLPYVYAHFINPDNLATALHAYRTHFRPSRFLDAPRVMMAVSALAGETHEEAQYFAKPRNIWAAQMLQNRAGRLLSMTEAEAYRPSEEEAAMIDMIARRSLTGTAEAVLDQLDSFRQAHAIDEFFLLTLTPDVAARKNSYTLMSAAAGLTQRADAAE